MHKRISLLESSVIIYSHFLRINLPIRGEYLERVCSNPMLPPIPNIERARPMSDSPTLRKKVVIIVQSLSLKLINLVDIIMIIGITLEKSTSERVYNSSTFIGKISSSSSPSLSR